MNIYLSSSLNYSANSYFNLGKHFKTSGCAKLSQNGFEVIQLLYCALDLHIYNAQVTFINLQLDFN